MWVRWWCATTAPQERLQQHTDGRLGRGGEQGRALCSCLSLQLPRLPGSWPFTCGRDSGKAAQGIIIWVVIASFSLVKPNASLCCWMQREVPVREVGPGTAVKLLPAPPTLITHNNSSKCLVWIKVALSQPQKLSVVQPLLSLNLQKAVI